MVETPTVSASDLAAVSPAGRTSDLLLIEVAKLQSDGEYLRRDIGEVRSDIREIRSEVKDIRAEFRTETQGIRSDIVDIRNDVKDIRSEMKEMRGEFRGEIQGVRGEIGGLGERVTRLEERVVHLPGKGFIVAVVSTALVLVGAVTTIMPRLQAMSAPPVTQSSQSAPR